VCVPLSCCLACCRGFMELAEACDVVRLWHAWPLARFVLLSTCVPTPRREERISDPLLWACPNPWRHQCERARVRGQTVATPVKARGAQGSGRRPARSRIERWGSRRRRMFVATHLGPGWSCCRALPLPAGGAACFCLRSSLPFFWLDGSWPRACDDRIDRVRATGAMLLLAVADRSFGNGARMRLPSVASTPTLARKDFYS